MYGQACRQTGSWGASGNTCKLPANSLPAPCTCPLTCQRSHPAGPGAAAEAASHDVNLHPAASRLLLLLLLLLLLARRLLLLLVPCCSHRSPRLSASFRCCCPCWRRAAASGAKAAQRGAAGAAHVLAHPVAARSCSQLRGRFTQGRRLLRRLRRAAADSSEETVSVADSVFSRTLPLLLPAGRPAGGLAATGS